MKHKLARKGCAHTRTGTPCTRPQIHNNAHAPCTRAPQPPCNPHSDLTPMLFLLSNTQPYPVTAVWTVFDVPSTPHPRHVRAAVYVFFAVARRDVANECLGSDQHFVPSCHNRRQIVGSLSINCTFDSTNVGPSLTKCTNLFTTPITILPVFGVRALYRVVTSCVL